MFSSSNRIIATTSLVLVIGLWISNQHFANQKLQTQWNRAIRHTLLGEYDLSAIIYASLYPEMKSNGKFLFMYGGVLGALGDHSKSISVLNDAVNYFSDPNLFMALGNSYDAIGEYNNAIEAYNNSWHIVPHKFYPLYRMMQTYHRSGNFEEARRTAQHIVDMPEKVSSPATRQMKSEAAEYLMGTHSEWPLNLSR